MLKAYKFRLYPTVEQSVLLEKHFGACRFIYNHFLALSKKDKVLKKSDMQKAIVSLKSDELTKNVIVTPSGMPAPRNPTKSGIDEQEQNGVMRPSTAARK